VQTLAGLALMGRLTSSSVRVRELTVPPQPLYEYHDTLKGDWTWLWQHPGFKLLQTHWEVRSTWDYAERKIVIDFEIDEVRRWETK